MPRAAAPATGIAGTPSSLLRSTLKAGGVAAAILVLVYLPAEYGVDPTGLGSVLGLTEMGEIKQQLRAEAEADAALAASPVPSVLPREVLGRLDRIEAEVAAIAAAVGAQAPLPGDAAGTDASTAPEAEPAEAAAPAEVAEAPVVSATTEPAPAPEAAEPAWRDSYEVTLAPGEGIEVKLAMEEGQTATFAWSANGGVVNHDTHGDGGGQNVTYEEGRAVPAQEGTLTAAFTGNHGWFWRNRTEAPVTLTLQTGGEYLEMRRP
ncbi:hypothetical protein FHG71_21770 [Rubellimicrobium roseum]|uniref:Transmembrane anchor protein n=1 Tax=Rubellimicrobium roseum TaxID=687525 RepID=A0A5C4N890_9RHOB|nr:hypothetical protein FHG71_21770 [Rubellimicrobium roseum]